MGDGVDTEVQGAFFGVRVIRVVVNVCGEGVLEVQAAERADGAGALFEVGEQRGGEVGAVMDDLVGVRVAGGGEEATSVDVECLADEDGALPDEVCR